MLLESPQVPFPWLQRSCAGSPWHSGILVTFREALGEILALSDRKRTFSFEVWGSGLFGRLSWSSLWTEGVPLVNSHSPQPRAPVPRSQTSPALGVMLSVLPLMKAAFQASKNKKIISLPSCWHLLHVDRPQSRAAPISLHSAAESLVGNVGLSTCWGGAGQKMLI